MNRNSDDEILDGVRKSRKIVKVSSNEIRALKEILDNFRTTKGPSSTLGSNSIDENQSVPSTFEFRASPKARVVEKKKDTLAPFNDPSGQNAWDDNSGYEDFINLLKESDEARSPITNKYNIDDITNFLPTTGLSSDTQTTKTSTESTTKAKATLELENISTTSEIANALSLDDSNLNFERQKLHFLMTLPVETTKASPLHTTKGKLSYINEIKFLYVCLYLIPCFCIMSDKTIYFSRSWKG